MPLQEAFSSLPEVIPAELGKFRRHIDPVWVEEALMATGRATVRRRRLPMVRPFAPGRWRWPCRQERDRASTTAPRGGPGRVPVRRHGSHVGDRECRAAPVARPVAVRPRWQHTARARLARELEGVRRPARQWAAQRQRVPDGSLARPHGLALAPARGARVRRVPHGRDDAGAGSVARATGRLADDW